MDAKTVVAKRVALELKSGTLATRVGSPMPRFTTLRMRRPV